MCCQFFLHNVDSEGVQFVSQRACMRNTFCVHTQWKAMAMNVEVSARGSEKESKKAVSYS